MSLVVAETTDDGLRIVSDTRVNFPDGRKSSFTTGTLKAIVLTRDVTICFTGDVVAGLDGVREFARGLGDGCPVDDLLTKLEELASDDRRLVEFIVSKGATGSQLIRIRKSRVEKNLRTAWIGDHEGFERFQKERNSPPDALTALLEKSGLPPSVRIMATLRRAMQAVIDDPAIESVGDFCVAVASKPTGFEYLGSTFIHVGRDFPINPGDNLISKMAQSAEVGGFAVSVVEPLEPGMPALGLNFPRARLGMLCLPTKFDGAQVISDVSPNDFAKVVHARFGVAMKDPSLHYW